MKRVLKFLKFLRSCIAVVFGLIGVAFLVLAFWFGSDEEDWFNQF